MVPADTVGKAGEDKRSLVGAEGVEEGITNDFAFYQVLLEDAECSIMLGVGAGGNCLEGVIDSSSDSIHEEVAFGSCIILRFCGRNL